MAVDDPVRICLDEMRGSDEAGAARKIARERRTSLLGRKGFASGLVGVATDGGDSDRDRGLELFRALLREAGVDARNRGSLGGRFLEEAAASVRALVRKDKLDPDRAIDLANAYAHGEVQTPVPLVSWLTDWMDALARSEGGVGRLDAGIDRTRQAGGDGHDLFRVVDKWLGLLPARKKAGTVRHIAGRTEDFGGRFALYWLLDASAEVRLAAAGGIGGRVKTRIAEPGSMSLVPLIRNWMPADAARRPVRPPRRLVRGTVAVSRKPAGPFWRAGIRGCGGGGRRSGPGIGDHKAGTRCRAGRRRQGRTSPEGRGGSGERPGQFRAFPGIPRTAARRGAGRRAGRRAPGARRPHRCRRRLRFLGAAAQNDDGTGLAGQVGSGRKRCRPSGVGTGKAWSRRAQLGRTTTPRSGRGARGPRSTGRRWTAQSPGTGWKRRFGL